MQELLAKIQIAIRKSNAYFLKDEENRHIISCQREPESQRIRDLDDHEVDGSIQVTINFIITDYLVTERIATTYSWQGADDDEECRFTRDRRVDKHPMADTAENFIERFINPPNS